MTHKIHDIGIASQIGSYSGSVEARPNLRWLITAGTPGLTAGGDPPRDFTAQAEMTWKNIIQILDKAGMTVADIVKATRYLIRPEDISTYAKVRKQFLGDIKPASMLLIIPQLVWPEMLLEVEVIAAKE